MDTREWLFLMSIVVVIAILMMLAAKWRRNRFDGISSGDYSLTGVDPELEENYGSELPSGGARTVGYRDHTDIERLNEEIRDRAEASRPRLSTFKPEPKVQQSLLPDPVVPDSEPPPSNDQQKSKAEIPLLLDPSDEHNTQDEGFEHEAAIQLKSLADELDHMDNSHAPVSEANKLNTNEDTDLDGDDTEKSKAVKSNGKSNQPSGDQKQGAKDRGNVGELIIINLMKKRTDPFDGIALARALKELGMRFGEHSIFHYCGRYGQDDPLFSMANLVKPGYFYIEDMKSLKTHALCFFFELEVGGDNMRVYETMLSVINKLREEFGGTLHDENRSVFTIQTSEHCRNRIIDFQRVHKLS